MEIYGLISRRLFSSDFPLGVTRISPILRWTQISGYRALQQLKKSPGGIQYRSRSPSAEYRRFDASLLPLSSSQRSADLANPSLGQRVEVPETHGIDRGALPTKVQKIPRTSLSPLFFHAGPGFRRVVTAYSLFLRHKARQLSEDYLSHSA